MILLRRKIRGFYLGRRKTALYLPLLAWMLSAVFVCWRLSRVTSDALLPPPPPDQSLGHFRRNRSLKYYLDNVQLLIEPSSPPCTNLEEVPLVVMVTSAPTRYEYRDAIRRTWGRHHPTYFLMGLVGDRIDDQLIDNYVEAKQHGDMLVFDFQEHYQNLTLKTALMMQWTLNRCPTAEFLYKTDDDMLVNPWTLKQVLKENVDAKLLGYVQNNTVLHREVYNKWFLPRWLCAEDVVPQYLTGPGYLISGDYLRTILRTAYKVPMINIEDVYFTYLVARKSLSFRLTHDDRLTPYRPWPPWLPISCAYWVQASIHSVTPSEMDVIWSRIIDIGKQFEGDKEVCWFYRRYVAGLVHLY